MRINVSVGIKAEASRKKEKGWIAERWTSFIGGFMIGARFDRGRTYANKGQVVDITVEPGAVRAKVVGSRARPYKIEIKFQTLSMQAWRNIANELRNDALLCAQVWDDYFPPELENLFEREGASLFPQLENDSSMECSCPDWSVPCKHIAAVFILLGDAFERDPFLIFKLRGMERENFLSLVRPNEANPVSTESESKELSVEPRKQNTKNKKKKKSLELSADNELSYAFAIPNPPNEDALILDEFGSFPFWKGERTIKQMLTPVYKSASEYAEKLLDKFG